MTDVLVVGAGPVGLYAAFYVAWRGLSVTVADALPEAGGQLSALYPEKLIHDVPGFPAVRAGELIRQLLAQLNLPGVHWALGEAVTGLSASGLGWTATRAGGGPLQARSVILAGGMGALLPREASVPGAGSLPTFTALPDPSALNGQRTLIWGGVPQATRAALELVNAGVHVTLAHRRALFRGTPEQLAQLGALQRAGLLDVMAPAVLQRLTPQGAELDGRFHPFGAAVLVNGYLPDLGGLRQIPALTWEGEYVVCDDAARTSLPGVFVAGDLSAAGGPFRLLARGFSEAAVAANHAVHAARPDLSVRPGHSSDRQRPVSPDPAVL